MICVELHEQEIIQALFDDFKKPAFESVATETSYILAELKYTIKNIHNWAKPQLVFPSIFNFPSTDYIYQEPYGKVLIIAPWNYPYQLALSPLIAAVAAGNQVVLKPSELTPNTSRIISKIISETFDTNHVTCIEGGVDVAQELLTQRWDYIFFTGSVPVGKIVAKAAATHLTPVTLELGGKGANIVFEDAPLDQAVEGIINGIFFNQGHVCCAGSRLLLQENIHDEFLSKLQKRMSKIRLGDPLDKNTDIGAINSAAQLAKIHELSSSGQAEGADIWSAPCQIPNKGFWFAPTIFTGVTQAHRIAREEIFGPVLSVLTFRTPQEAIEKANNTPFGLSAGVWSDKGSRILWAGNHLKAGVIWANTFNKFDPASPFGGYKESGWGREGGRHGLGAYIKGAKK